MIVGFSKNSLFLIDLEGIIVNKMERDLLSNIEVKGPLTLIGSKEMQTDTFTKTGIYEYNLQTGEQTQIIIFEPFTSNVTFTKSFDAVYFADNNAVFYQVINKNNVRRVRVIPQSKKIIKIMTGKVMAGISWRNANSTLMYTHVKDGNV